MNIFSYRDFEMVLSWLPYLMGWYAVTIVCFLIVFFCIKERNQAYYRWHQTFLFLSILFLGIAVCLFLNASQWFTEPQYALGAKTEEFIYIQNGLLKIYAVFGLSVWGAIYLPVGILGGLLKRYKMAFFWQILFTLSYVLVATLMLSI
ncbi:hypothetical protein [Basilea psittacipulmonis]|uniref:Uncharacterized protein n=1 Tax=Basilea psittacipulmonis DSM 24701 TaxID=1072685 RepID=A0A077DDR0_9BURK|nr:hypothetical protein [Basilea psittacipulmonis]AIL32261.1 hypothetical protein IX83_02075 [Basilea psittacipulmonis DSM 24701]